MSKHYLIPNIDKIVAQKVKELKLKPKFPLDYFKEKNKRFYSTPCQTEDGRMVFLKILISKRKQDALHLKKEIAITKFLSEQAQKSKGLNIPLFVAANTRKHPYWFLHQYLPGPITGSFYEMNKNGLQEETRKTLVNNLVVLQSIPFKQYKKLLRIPLEKRGSSHYLNKIKRDERSLKEKDYPINFKQIYDLFEGKKKYFETAELVLNHGDYTLANFFTHKKKTYITDWEHVHLNNFAYDIAHLWIQTFRFPAWRRKLILDFIARIAKNKIEIFKELFRVIIITEALGEIIMGLNISPKHKLEARKINIITIEAALKSFDALMAL